jgi:hypothetical protein
MKGWVKPKLKDTARNMAMLRIAKAWKQLTRKPATYSTAAKKISSDNPDDPAPRYYNGNRYGEFLDFFTAACGLIGIAGKSPDADVGHFIELKGDHPDQL